MFFPQDIEYLISPRALAANFFCFEISLSELSYKLSIVGRDYDWKMLNISLQVLCLNDFNHDSN